MKDLINLMKKRGFIFQGSEIYGGLSNTWDYGPLGVELKNRLKQNWWKHFISDKENMVGLDSGILMNPKVWEASGHSDLFCDIMMDCKHCKTRYRIDKFVETHFDPESKVTKDLSILINNLSKCNKDEISELINKIENLIKLSQQLCPKCKSNNFTNIKNFNLMFKTYHGTTEDIKNQINLRPETAQGIFINFLNIQQSMRLKIPFGVGQIGKAFRNEITPGNFIFRTREFEQMEIEYFVEPGNEDNAFSDYLTEILNWLYSLNFNKDKIRTVEHDKDSLSHYSKRTVDIEYKFSFGWGEIIGIASRSDFDLKSHTIHSNAKLEYFDPNKNIKYTPYVIEPSFGLDRCILAIIDNAYTEEKLKNDTSRIVMNFSFNIAPIQVAILPLKKNKFEIVDKAKKLFNKLKSIFIVKYDDNGSIGKLYRKQDEIGTPFCITIDFDTIKDNTVTIRNRINMKQEKIAESELINFIKKSIYKV